MKKSRRLHFEAEITRILQKLSMHACNNAQDCVEKVLVTVTEPGRAKLLCYAQISLASELFTKQALLFLLKNFKLRDLGIVGFKKNTFSFIVTMQSYTALKKVADNIEEFVPSLNHWQIRDRISYALADCKIESYGKHNKNGVHINSSRLKGCCIITLLGTTKNETTKSLIVDTLTQLGCICKIRAKTFSIKVFGVAP